jgi:hypothetical protein
VPADRDPVPRPRGAAAPVTRPGAAPDAGVAPVARAITLPGDPAAWERLGFAPGEPIGAVRSVPGAPALELGVQGLAAERPDGLAIVTAAPGAAEPGAHPNGALAVDHVVALTGDMERTIGALRAAGLDLRRERVPPEAPARQAFFHLGTMILELVEAPGREPALWGLVVVVEDLDGLGPLVGAARDAVQPGRRIATARREAELPTALAFMTPRPQRSPAS